MDSDPKLTGALRALSATGARGELAVLTDFEWDAVNVFGEGTRREEIEAVVGDPIVSDRRYYDAGHLLVFTCRGDVVRAVSVVPDILAVAHPTWTSDVRLEPVDPTATPAVLRLVEPA